MGDPTIEVLCKNCGQTFTAFLRKMADKNAVVTCPCCGKDSANALNNAMLSGAKN